MPVAEVKIKEKTYTASCVDAIVNFIYELNRLDNIVSAGDVATAARYDWTALMSYRDHIEEQCDINLPDITPVKDSVDLLTTYGPPAMGQALVALRQNIKQYVSVIKNAIKP